MFIHLVHVFLFVCLIYCVWNLLSAGCRVVGLPNCGVCPRWVGLDLVKLSWLGGFVPVLWWMELDLVSLKGSAMSSSVSWGDYGLGMALGSLSDNGQGCVSVLLMIWHAASSIGAF